MRTLSMQTGRRWRSQQGTFRVVKGVPIWAGERYANTPAEAVG